MTPFSMRSSKNAMSSARSASTVRKTCLSSASARSRCRTDSANAISGSIIQNSAVAAGVLDDGARVAVRIFPTLSNDYYPSGYEAAAWVLTGIFGAVAVALYVLARIAGEDLLRVVGLGALLFDTSVIASYATIFSYEYGSPTRWATMFAVAEAALRYGLRGGIAVPVLLSGFFVFAEWWRSREFGPPAFSWDRVTFPSGLSS